MNSSPKVVAVVGKEIRVEEMRTSNHFETRMIQTGIEFALVNPISRSKAD